MSFAARLARARPRAGPPHAFAQASPSSCSCSRSYATGAGPGGSGAERPASSLFSLDTLYPFLLLSAITSLALNLGHSRSAFANEADHLRAQLSVLESILADERARRPLSPDEHERVERQLELVGLGRGKGKEEHVVKGRFGETAWGEVFFGKKGREWEGDNAAEEAEWNKLVQEATEADRAAASTASAAKPPVSPPLPPSSASSSPEREHPTSPQAVPSSESDVYL